MIARSAALVSRPVGRGSFNIPQGFMDGERKMRLISCRCFSICPSRRLRNGRECDAPELDVAHGRARDLRNDGGLTRNKSAKSALRCPAPNPIGELLEARPKLALLFSGSLPLPDSSPLARTFPPGPRVKLNTSLRAPPVFNRRCQSGRRWANTIRGVPPLRDGNGDGMGSRVEGTLVLGMHDDAVHGLCVKSGVSLDAAAAFLDVLDWGPALVGLLPTDAWCERLNGVSS